VVLVEVIEVAEDDVGDGALEGCAAGNGLSTTWGSDGMIESSNSLGSCFGCVASKCVRTSRERAIVVSAEASLGGDL
jgi:hypothetical protein